MKKKFDCVKMKNDIQAAMYAEMKEMPPEEQRAYIHRRAEEFWKTIGGGRPKPRKGRRQKQRV
jgi:hypothetical protein